jgi:KICSTOR complex protein kaptin
VTGTGLDFSRTLYRSDDFDVATCATIADVDFDGEKEIVIGTYGQELLVYKLMEKFEEVKKKSETDSTENKLG